MRVQIPPQRKLNSGIHIIGGGTFSHVRSHFALAAPAFGSTARALSNRLPGSTLHLTKMAGGSGNLVTNRDIENLVDRLIAESEVSVICMSAALCDFDGKIGKKESGKYAERLETREGAMTLHMTPANKVIKKIRENRKDIFLVGFKTTTNASSEVQFHKGLRLLKEASCGLVLANDTGTRSNMIITPEEAAYCVDTNRDRVLDELVEMINFRSGNTFSKSNFIDSKNIEFSNTPDCFQKVMRHVIERGGYIPNVLGFTTGHFGVRTGQYEFLSSQRKLNHNKLEEFGLCKVLVENNKLVVHGKGKATVGSRTIWELFQKFPSYDAVVHTHNPIKPNSKIPIISQKPFHCGSFECAKNVAENMLEFKDYGVAAVFADKHGANIMFRTSQASSDITKFLDENIQFGVLLNRFKKAV